MIIRGNYKKFTFFKIKIKIKRLMTFSRVINDEICFLSKEVYNVYEMFHTRYTMHKQIYTHTKLQQQ